MLGSRVQVPYAPPGKTPLLSNRQKRGFTMISVSRATGDIPCGYDICFADDIRFAYEGRILYHFFCCVKYPLWDWCMKGGYCITLFCCAKYPLWAWCMKGEYCITLLCYVKSVSRDDILLWQKNYSYIKSSNDID